MKQHYCFVANYDLTYFFHALALELQQQGFQIFWICNNHKQQNFLLQHYPTERILLIDRHLAQQVAEPVADLKLNELIYGDRVLREEADWPLPFLRHLQRPFYDFIQRHQIDFVFGETTWAHEVLLMRILKACPELGARYLVPQGCRIPNGHFAFFTDEANAELLEVSHLNKPLAEVTQLLLERPFYQKTFDILLAKAQRPKARFSKLKRFFNNENFPQEVLNDPCLSHNRRVRFKLRVREEFNRITYPWLKRASLSELSGKKILLYPLHMQPEATVDVIGRYYDDQLQLIRNLWRVLPDDWYLVVKEHSNAVGNRGLKFFNAVTQLPRCLLADERINSHELIRQCQAVATISGTCAYEAALSGIPSLTFAPVFFNRLSLCRRITLEDLAQCANLPSLLPTEDAQRDTQTKAWFLKQFFPGIPADPIVFPQSLNPDNLQKVTAGFAALSQL